jgi:hypothetical protein
MVNAAPDLKSCYACKSTVANGAKACPHCGAASPSGTRRPASTAAIVLLLLAVLALLATACRSTGPDDFDVPANGFYDYTMQAQVGGATLSYTGDLVLSNASPVSLSYRWIVSGFTLPGVLSATYDLAGRWFVPAQLGGNRAAVHTITRNAAGYQCAVRITEPGVTAVDGACSIVYVRPDTTEAAPAP